jgi:hypothetical protein
LCGYDILRDQALRDDHALEDVDTVNMPSSPSLGKRKEQEAQEQERTLSAMMKFH